MVRRRRKIGDKAFTINYSLIVHVSVCAGGRVRHFECVSFLDDPPLVHPLYGVGME